MFKIYSAILLFVIVFPPMVFADGLIISKPIHIVGTNGQGTSYNRVIVAMDGSENRYLEFRGDHDKRVRIPFTAGNGFHKDTALINFLSYIGAGSIRTIKMGSLNYFDIFCIEVVTLRFYGNNPSPVEQLKNFVGQSFVDGKLNFSTPNECSIIL